jgi:hypothetical protein
VTNYSGADRKKVCAMKPGSKPSSGMAMTHAEKQPSFACSVARYRTKQAEGAPTRAKSDICPGAPFRPGGLAATELLHDVKRNQVVAEWTIDGRTLVIINRRIG